MVRTKLGSVLGQLVAGKPPSGFARGAGKSVGRKSELSEG